MTSIPGSSREGQQRADRAVGKVGGRKPHKTAAENWERRAMTLTQCGRHQGLRMGSSPHREHSSRTESTSQGHFLKPLSVLKEELGDCNLVICETALDVLYHRSNSVFIKGYSSLFIILETPELSMRSSSRWLVLWHNDGSVRWMAG